MENLPGLQISQMVYQSPDGCTQIMKGYWESYPVAIKVLPFSASAMKESKIQNSLSCLDSVCKIYQVVDKQEAGQIWIIMEWLEGDLYVEIQRRLQEQQFWSEEELWGMFRVLIYTHAFAQSYGIAHRDIKPQNIFYTHPNSLKVGDFGCAKDLFSETAESIIGSPYFFSPEIKRAYRTSLSCVNAPRTPYNAFKSDVYSLGMTFLMMVTLRAHGELLDLDRLETSTEAVLNQNIRSESMKELIRLMLWVDPGQRCDFSQLYAYVEGLFQPQCATPESILTYLNSIQEEWIRYGLEQLMQSGKTAVPVVVVYLHCSCGAAFHVNISGEYGPYDLMYCSWNCYNYFDSNAQGSYYNMKSVALRPSAAPLISNAQPETNVIIGKNRQRIALRSLPSSTSKYNYK